MIHNHRKERTCSSLGLFSVLSLFSLGIIVTISLIALCSTNPFTILLKNHFHQNLGASIPPQNHSHQHAPILPQNADDEKCDLFKGRWIPTNQEYSAYSSEGCAWIPDWKNCFKHGRKDVEFVNWRWKPQGCNLPRFNPNIFFKIVQNKHMMFIGDSVARNQMESLLCLLSKEEVPTETEKDDEDEFRTLHFKSHNFTVTFLRSIFLVKSEEIIVNGSSSGSFNLHLDKVDGKWAEKLPGTDYAIISGAHWFFRKNYLYEHKNLIGCVHCSEPNVTNLGLDFAVAKAFRTSLKFIHGCKNCQGLMTLLRTFSPAHFENGTWNTGGYCNRTRPLSSEKEVNLGGSEWELRNVQIEEIERARKEGSKSGYEQRFRVLDVTMAMLMRPDGHPGSHWGNQWMKGINDCLHWCLPGPIDAWNDWLLAVLREETSSLLVL